MYMYCSIFICSGRGQKNCTLSRGMQLYRLNEGGRGGGVHVLLVGEKENPSYTPCICLGYIQFHEGFLVGLLSEAGRGGLAGGWLIHTVS